MRAWGPAPGRAGEGRALPQRCACVVRDCSGGSPGMSFSLQRVMAVSSMTARLLTWHQARGGRGGGAHAWGDERGAAAAGAPHSLPTEPAKAAWGRMHNSPSPPGTTAGGAAWRWGSWWGRSHTRRPPVERMGEELQGGRECVCVCVEARGGVLGGVPGMGAACCPPPTHPPTHHPPIPPLNPSAPTFVALKKASALISAARSAAAVSVVKKGLPVPAPKMTTRPRSRWRIARRRM